MIVSTDQDKYVSVAPRTPSPSPIMLAASQIFAGGLAGTTETSLMHPLDVLKTRFQIQRGPDDPQRYKSYMDCIKRMARSEGILSFYKGILPPVLAETPKNAIKFFSFEKYRSMLTRDDGKIEHWGLVLAGLGTGLSEGVMITPFERVKVSLQAHRNKSPSTWEHAKYIVKHNGFGRTGLLKGMSATLWRHGIWNTVYFSIYHSIIIRKSLNHQTVVPLPVRWFYGFLAGSLACCVNIPFDVAKSRIQGPQPSGQQDKYIKTLQTVALVYREEGLPALYKGLIPKILRYGPGGGIMLVVYEQVSKWLQAQAF